MRKVAQIILPLVLITAPFVAQASSPDEYRMNEAYLSDSGRPLVTQHGLGGCLSISDNIINAKEKTDSLAYRTLFLSSFSDSEAVKAITSDHSATKLVEEKSISRRNLSFQYYRIMHMADIVGKSEREMYSMYIQWLGSVYGQNLPVEGVILQKFLEDWGQQKNLSGYLSSVIISSMAGKPLSSDSHVNLFESCVAQERAKMTPIDHATEFIWELKKIPTETAKAMGGFIVLLLGIIGTLIFRLKSKKEHKKNIEAERIGMKFVSSFKEDGWRWVQQTAKSLVSSGGQLFKPKEKPDN